MKKILFTLFKSILYIISIFILYVLFFPLSKIHSIQIKTDKGITQTKAYQKKEKELWSYLQKHKGRYLWKVNLKEVAKQAESINLDWELSIKRKYPNQLLVFLNQKKTFVILLADDQTFYSVSHNGSLGNQINRLKGLNFPVLRGKAFEESLELRQRILGLLNGLPRAGQTFSSNNISEILYHKNNNSFLFYLSSQPLILELAGRPSSKKIENIDFVLSYLKKMGREQGFIDARLDKKIIVKKRKQN